jgi:hypothetical protein
LERKPSRLCNTSLASCLIFRIGWVAGIASSKDPCRNC